MSSMDDQTINILQEAADELKASYTQEIICPNCFREYSDSWEYSDYDDNMICPDCGQSFYYERHLEVTYSSKKNKEKDNG